jgi:hypothetical protein
LVSFSLIGTTRTEGTVVVDEVDEVVDELIVEARRRLLDDVEEVGSIPCERT